MRSFLAILAGLAFTVLVSLGLDAVVDSQGITKSAVDEKTLGDWLIHTSYRLIAAIGGGWITARLAPARPMFFAMVLGGIGTGLALLGLVGTWLMTPKMGPLWYPFVLVITAIPCTWVGGKLAAK